MSVAPRSLGFRTDLAVRVAEGSLLERHDGFWCLRSPTTPDFYWGNALILDAPQGPIEADACEELFRSCFPSARHVALGFDSGTVSLEDFDDFARRGYDRDVLTMLTARPDDLRCARETSVDVRPLRDDEWRQWVALGLHTRGEGFDVTEYRDFLTSRVAGLRLACSSGRAQWFGAFEGDELVSHVGIYDVGGGVSRFQQVATLPRFQRRGFATAAILAASDHAATVFGATTLVMGADPDYHALTLYQALGFRPQESQVLLLCRA